MAHGVRHLAQHSCPKFRIGLRLAGRVGAALLGLALLQLLGEGLLGPHRRCAAVRAAPWSLAPLGRSPASFRVLALVTGRTGQPQRLGQGDGSRARRRRRGRGRRVQTEYAKKNNQKSNSRRLVGLFKSRPLQSASGQQAFVAQRTKHEVRPSMTKALPRPYPRRRRSDPGKAASRNTRGAARLLPWRLLRWRGVGRLAAAARRQRRPACTAGSPRPPREL